MLTAALGRGSDAIISFADGDTLTLLNVQKADLHTNDFLLA
jgi:hypothetical protein